VLGSERFTRSGVSVLAPGFSRAYIHGMTTSRTADLTILPLSALPGIDERIVRTVAAFERVTARGEDATAVRANLLDAVAIRANILRPHDAYAPVYARDYASYLLSIGRGDLIAARSSR
jgi:hypothetical protein